MTECNAALDGRSEIEKTPLVLDGVSHEDLTTGFLREIHRAADSEGLPLESISVETQ